MTPALLMLVGGGNIDLGKYLHPIELHAHYVNQASSNSALLPAIDENNCFTVVAAVYYSHMPADNIKAIHSGKYYLAYRWHIELLCLSSNIFVLDLSIEGYFLK